MRKSPNHLDNLSLPLMANEISINDVNQNNDDVFERYEEFSQDFISYIQNMSVEMFLEQNFDQVKLFDEEESQNNIFHSFNKLVNDKIIVFKEKCNSLFKQQIQKQNQPQYLIPQAVSFQFDKTKTFLDQLNGEAFVEVNKHQQAIIQMDNNEDHQAQKKNLTKQQLKSIKKTGEFFTYKNNEPIKWVVSETFYAPKKNQPVSQEKSKYAQFAEILWNKYNFIEWKNKGIISGNSLKSFSLLQGLIRLIRIPSNIVALLFGEPFYQVPFIPKGKTLTQELKLQFCQLVKKKFPFKIRSSHFLSIVSKVNFSFENHLMEAINKLDRGEIVLKEGLSAQKQLLFYCYNQFAIEFGKQLEGEMSKQDIEYLQNNFLAYITVQPLIRKYKDFKNNHEYISKKFNSKRVELLKDYELHPQYEFATQLNSVFQTYSGQYPPENGKYYENGSVKADCYFWKLKYMSKMLSEYSSISTSLKENLVYGKYGWEVCFKKESKKFNQKTISKRFQDIKDKIATINRKSEDEEEGDDGIFGPCCSQTFKCLGNYIFRYFFKGLLYTNIFLRLVCLSWMLIYGFFYLLYLVAVIPFMALYYLFLIMIYDFTLPEENSYTYPVYLPLPALFLRFSLSILTIFISCFLFLLATCLEFISSSWNGFTTIFPRIKNNLSYLLIYLLAQVPSVDSKYCKKDLNIYQNEDQYYQLTFEQVKIFIDQYFSKIPFEILIQNLHSYMNNLQNNNKIFSQKVNEFLPFQADNSKIKRLQTIYQKEFEQSLKQMIEYIESQFIQVRYNSNMNFKYSNQQYNKLFQATSDYLRTKYGTQKQYEGMWSYLNCQENDYESMTTYLFQIIFYNKIQMPVDNKNRLIHKMETNSDLLNQVNSYLSDKYDQKTTAIKSKDTNVTQLFYSFVEEYNF